MTTQDFSGCIRACRQNGEHARKLGCVEEPRPEPAVSMSYTAVGADGMTSTCFDRYTVTDLTELIATAIGDRGAALAAAKAIIYRHQPEITVGGRLPRCVNCEEEIENRGEPDMGGNHRIKWVHVPGGFTPCLPQIENSVKASPGNSCPHCGSGTERHQEDDFVWRSGDFWQHCSVSCGQGKLLRRS